MFIHHLVFIITGQRCKQFESASTFTQVSWLPDDMTRIWARKLVTASEKNGDSLLKFLSQLLGQSCLFWKKF